MRKFILSLSLILLTFSVALADSSDVKDSAGVFPIGLYEDKIYDKLASSTRANATLDDIYNALFHNNISVGDYQFFIANTLGRHFSGTDGVYIDTLLQNNNTKLDTANTILGNQYNRLVNIRDNIATTNSKLEYVFNAVEDTINIKWYPTNISSQWVLNSNNQVISSSQSGSAFSMVFNNFYSYYDDIPLLFRVYVPFMSSSLYDVNSDFDLTISYFDPSNNALTPVSFDNYFLESTTRGTYIYIFDFRPHNVSYLSFTLSGAVQYDSNYSGYVYTIPFDTLDYQSIKTAFYQMKSANLQGQDSDNIQALKDVYASDDLIQAKQAQQAVEDEVIDTFSGNGSERMTVNDVRGVKDVSSNAKQFLGTGSSSSNALSIFTINGQGFWVWFSQTTSDNLDTSSNNRKSSDDYISIYDKNLEDYYNGLGGLNAR